MDGVLGAAASFIIRVARSGASCLRYLVPSPVRLGAAWVGLVPAAPALLRCRLFGRNDRQQERGCRPAPKCRAGDAAEDVHGTIARLAVRPRVPDWRVGRRHLDARKNETVPVMTHVRQQYVAEVSLARHNNVVKAFRRMAMWLFPEVKRDESAGGVRRDP